MTTRLKNENGAAIIIALFFMVILYGLSGIFLLRVINEAKMARVERESAKAFYSAQGAAQTAVDQLDVLINTDLKNTISSANPNGVISYTSSEVNSGDGIGWLIYAVRDGNGGALLAQDGDEASYSGSGTLGEGAYQYNIVITEKGDPEDAGVDAWDFPYSYTIEAGSTTNGVTSQVSLNGDFTIRVQRDNFAKFALFTNYQTTESGQNVWFTDKTNFAGPVHTNGRFNFAFNPSGTFEQSVTQEDQYARFYNYGWTVLLDDDHNGTRDVPVFHGDFQRNADPVVLDSSVEEGDMADQATGGQNFGSNGIYVPNDGSNVEGGIYIKGDSDSITMSVSNGKPVYTIAQGSTTKIVTIDQTANQTKVEDVSTGVIDTYNGVPDGVDNVGPLIFVDGSINSLSGTVQADTQVTVASKNDIVISNNIMYENYTPAVGSPGDAGYVPPSAEGATNLLGIVTWEGDVRIGTSAPDDVQVQGTILASSGVFQVDDYGNIGAGPRGTATLLGGVISNNYGAFGLFSGSTGNQLSGYGRNFVYDERMANGESPPYFPTLNTFIAFTNDITDKTVWREGE